MAMKLPQTYQDPKIFNNKYIVKHQISSGSFGVVYLAFDKHTKEEVAIKLEKEENEEVCTLDREVQILQKLVGLEGIPKLFWNGFEQDYNVMVLQLLGKDLAFYMKQHKKLSIKTVLQLAQQLVFIVQKVHQRGVIHRDMKPENLLVGNNDTSVCFLVDFGVSKIYLENNQHIPFKDKKSFIGTTRYASIAAHKGLELGRKDDIESLFYVLIYFIKGKLPWQNLQNIGDRDRTEVVGEVKQKTELSELCKDLPKEFISILSYVKSLEFKSEPNYTLIQQNITKAAASLNIVLDRVFDWTEKTPTKQGTQESLKLSKNLKQSSSQIVEQTGQQNQDPKLKDSMIWAVNEQKNGLLKPPEPRMSIVIQKNERCESRNNSFMSNQGSFSSMQIKYIPSRVENGGSSMVEELDQLQGSPKKQQIQKTQTAMYGNINAVGVPDQSPVKSSNVVIIKKQVTLEANLLSSKQKSSPQFDINKKQSPEQQHKISNFQSKKSIESTWGFKGEMDEFIDDSPRLSDKYSQLQKGRVELFNVLVNKLRVCNQHKSKSVLNALHQ